MPLLNGSTPSASVQGDGASAFEAELLNFDPCHFPSLALKTKLSTATSSFSSCQVEFDLPKEAADFLSQERIDSLRLCLAAWALVVGCYVGTKSVCFAHLPKNTHSLHQNGGESKDATEHLRLQEVFTYNLDPELPVQELLQKPSLNEKFEEYNSDTVAQSLKRINKLRGIGQYNTALASDDDLDASDLTNEFSLVLSIDSSRLYNSARQSVALKYSTAILDDLSAPRIVHTFITALQDIVLRPHILQTDVQLLSDYDKSLLWKWNTSIIQDPVEELVHNALARFAKQDPNHEAVYAWDGTFTYSELNELADRFASYLYAKNVKPNDVVPICWSKSKWVPVMIFGVMKAGGAAAMLDLSHPPERRRLMAEQVEPKLLVSEDIYAHFYDDMNAELIVDVPGICAREAAPSGPISSGVSPHNVAYVAFTSGSSGVPKCALHTHLSYFNWVHPGESTGFERGSRVLNFFPHGFIAGFSDITHAIASGATVCIPSEADRTTRLRQFISESQPTHTTFTPSFLRTLGPDDIPKTTFIATGGEMIEPAFIEKWRKTHPIIQAYGQSEGAISTDFYDGSITGIKMAKSAGWITVPGQFNKLMPIGAVGILSTQGPMVFKGYLNDPDLTREKLPERPPWMTDEGSFGKNKILFTGDLARLESDGSFTIVGRADTQVKIHGQRIELSEIENRMLQNLQKGTKVAVDLIKPIDGTDRPILTAIIVLPPQSDDRKQAEGSSESQNQEHLNKLIPALEASLARVIPKYAIPKAFISRASMPYTHNGKLQRKVLRDEYSALDRKAFRSLMTGSDEKDSPQTDSERTIQSFWAEVLQLDESFIGRDDDFFALGGDSLLVIKLISQARRHGLEITTKMVFENPLLRQLSNVAKRGVTNGHINGKEISTKEIKLPPWLDKSNIESVHEASDAQTWMALAGTFKTHGWVDYLMYDIKGPLDESHLDDCCQKLIDRYDILRIAFVAHEKKTYQVVLKHVPLRMRNLKVESSNKLDEASQWVFDHDLQRHWILGQPYTSFILVTASPTEHRLMLRISHAQYDAGCYATFGEQLGLAYGGKDFTVTPSFSKFLDFSRSIQSDKESSQFWQARLKGARIPKLVERSEAQGPAYGNHHNTDLVKTIEDPRLHSRGIIRAVVVKAAWAAVIASMTGDRDVTFGDFASTRSVPLAGVEDVVGACLNFPPFRINMNDLFSSSSQPTILDYLRFVQDEHLAGISHETRGFRDVIESCSPWPKWERLSSIVNCTNFDTNRPLDRETTWRGANNGEELTVTPGYLERWHDKSDLWLLTMPTISENGETSLEVTLRFNDQIIERTKAEAILDLYCRTVDDFAARPDQPFALPKLPETPNLCAPLGVFRPPRDGDLSDPNEVVLSQYWQNATNATVESVVNDVWGIVLGQERVASLTPETRFYDVWADLIGASQMQLEYYLRGAFVDVEAIIAQPTMKKQTQMLSMALSVGIFR